VQMRAILRRARYGYLLAFHILLLCAAGRNPTEIAAFLFCSRSGVYRIVRAYRTGSLGIQVDPDGQLSIAVQTTVLMPWLTRSLGALLVSVHRGLSIMCGAMLSLSSEPTMPIRRSELHPERWATLVGYGNGIASGHQQHDLAFSLFATGRGANPRCGPGPCADAPNSTARAATAASPAPTPGRYAARAAGQNLQNLQEATIVRLACHKAYAAPLIQQTW